MPGSPLETGFAPLVMFGVPLVVAAAFKREPVPFYLEAAVIDVRWGRGPAAAWGLVVAAYLGLVVGVAGLTAGLDAVLLGGVVLRWELLAGVVATLLLGGLEPTWAYRHGPHGRAL